MALLVIIASMIFGAISGVVAVFIYDRHIGLLTRADYDNLIEAEREYILKMIDLKNDAVKSAVRVEILKNEAKNMEFVNNTISMWQREQEALLAKINSDYEQHKRWSLGIWNKFATLKEHINEIPTEIVEQPNAFNTEAAEPEKDKGPLFKFLTEGSLLSKPKQLHYVKVPENLIVIDSDLKSARHQFYQIEKEEKDEKR